MTQCKNNQLLYHIIIIIHYTINRPATTHTPTISKPSSVVCPPPEVRMPKMPTNPSTVYSYSVTAGRGGLKHGRGEPPSISVGRGRGVGRGIVGIEQSNKSVGIVSLTNESVRTHH